MTMNIFYRLQNKEYTFDQREELEDIIGSIDLEARESEAIENYKKEGCSTSEFILRGDRCLIISIEPEVDDEDESEEYNVPGDEAGHFSALQSQSIILTLSEMVSEVNGWDLAEAENEVRYWIEKVGNVTSDGGDTLEFAKQQAKYELGLESGSYSLFLDCVDDYLGDGMEWYKD